MRLGAELTHAADQYTTNFKRGNENVRQQVHYTGNNMKAMHISVEASLKKLRTDYIDILYVHWVCLFCAMHAPQLIVVSLVGLGYWHGGNHERTSQPRGLWEGFVPSTRLTLDP